MFCRKLRALNCYLADSFNSLDESHFRTLVLWLEDQKIRLYNIENRNELRQIDNDEVWINAFNKYLTDLKCPCRYSSDANNKNALVDWLLSFAVKLEFTDNAEFYKNRLKQCAQKSEPGNVVSQNPLDNLNFEDPEFKRGVEQLATILNITRHPDHLVTLKAVSKLICERLSNAALKEALENSKKPDTSVTIKLDEFDAGFDSGDYVLNNAAKILRLLHVKELRDLQTHINETIVDLQQISADPKTDERLGKVGVK